MDAEPQTTRRSQRRRSGDAAPSLHQLPWQLVTNPYPPMAIISADQLESIHEASLQVLQEIGTRVLLREAREIYRAGGATVDDGTMQVRFERGLIEQALATVPSQFTLHARNPDRNVTMGGRHVVFATTAGTPNVSDLAGGRRPGNFQDYCNLLKLAQSLNIVHVNGGYVPEPIDIPVPVRHLKAGQAMLTLSDKALWAFTFAPQRMRDTFEMVRIARGIDESRMLAEASFYTVVNTNSPLQLDQAMAWGVIEMARLGQAVCITPFTLAGAMAPVTLAGALVQQNAEALGAIVLSQLVRKGAPLIYGGFTSNVDMRTGSPAFGTPEYVQGAIIGGQLARRYSIPYRSSNVNAANTVDAQATYESAMSIWGAMMGGVNLMLHGTGWLEGGLTASYEKYIVDAEMLQTMSMVMRPLQVDKGTMALDAIRDVGPGGHFFGTAHTLERYREAFYTPLLSDWSNFEQWTAAGSVDTTQRAHRIWKTMIAQYEQPAMDPARAEELEAFVDRRCREGGADIE
ncbi:trimethylamine methyltransferase family protein [Hypericibacter sp.]|uniref:trimethylamine methyltransferase family protein n=1 Tax=Hypericibacter sp. TaxID=2705401 RepID=UPI003D6CC1BB